MHEIWIGKFLRQRFSTQVQIKTSIPPHALRNANKMVVSHSFGDKLEQIARPFKTLLGQLSVSDAKRDTIFGFGIKDTDLQITGVSENLRRILSLEMLNQSQVKRHIIHEAMRMFCRRTNDTGSPEVQAAIWSVKIAALEQHTTEYRHDYVAERRIQEWKDQRRKILKYLKRVSLERYFECVDRLGLPHDLVEVQSPRFPTKPIERPKSKERLRKIASKPK